MARGAPQGQRRTLARICLAGLFALSACVATVPMGDNISYAPPVPAGAGPLVLGVDGDRGQALRSIAASLRRAGFEIESRSEATGEMRATSRRQDLANCGLLTQVVGDTAAKISGTAPLAAIFDDSVPDGVLRREVRVTTDVTVRIAEGNSPKAWLDEKQTITIRKLTADRDTVLSSQTLEVVNGKAVTYLDGTVCTSSGKLAEAFR